MLRSLFLLFTVPKPTEAWTLADRDIWIFVLLSEEIGVRLARLLRNAKRHQVPDTRLDGQTWFGASGWRDPNTLQRR